MQRNGSAHLRSGKHPAIMHRALRANTLTRLVVISASLILSRAALSQPFLRDADIQGDRVVFSCEGDIWLAAMSTGQAERITGHDGVSSNARFSPDGSRIAFTGQYDGGQDVYVMPAAGGMPHRLTYTGGAACLGWTPDGSRILFVRRWDFFGRPTKIYTVPAVGGWPTALPLEIADSGAYAPDGRRFVFTRINRKYQGWFGYRGGMKNDIWVGNIPAKQFKKIYASSGTNEYPVWAGRRVYFVNDSGGQFSVVSALPDGSSLRREVGPYPVEIRSLHTDGKQLVYERGFGLEIHDLATGANRPLTFHLLSDLRYTRPYYVSAQSWAGAQSLGPTGQRVLFEARGQIVSVPAKEGESRVVLAIDGARLREPQFSPDGKRIAYLSDETREMQLFAADADGSHARQLTHDTGRQLCKLHWSPDGKWIELTDSLPHLRLVAADGSRELAVGSTDGGATEGPMGAFSPDSKWLVYSAADGVAHVSALVLYDIQAEKSTRLGEGMYSDFAPSFSRDGRWLCFLSRRAVSAAYDPFLAELTTSNATTRAFLLALRKDTVSPLNPKDDEEGQAAAAAPAAGQFHIDLDGLYDRLIPLPLAPGRYEHIQAAADRVYASGDGAVAYYELKAEKSGTVPQAVAFELSADGKKMLLQGPSGWRVVDAASPEKAPADENLKFADLQLRIDPMKEWEEIYWDAWRLVRDYFYVTSMHGANWPAVGAKYAQYLPSLRSRSELTELLRWMEAELDVGHTSAGGGDMRTSPPPGRLSYLGVDLEPDATGYLRITHIYRGDGEGAGDQSPFAAPGVDVHEGYYLIAVGGAMAHPGTDFMDRLMNRAGQVISVRVNSRPTDDGAHTVYVKPVASEARMRYVDWVEHNRQYVTRISGGKVGYVHLAAMGDGDMADFIRQYFPQRNRQALLVDVRFNGGGSISGAIIDILAKRPAFYFSMRNNSADPGRQSDAFVGPMACVTNEFAGSDGDLFPYQFRWFHLGPLIGRRGWGGVVGPSPIWSLVDRGFLWVPRYGAFSPEKGWIIEGHGVDMDYDVESDPNDYARGDDPQLDKSVAILLEALKKNPPHAVVQPPDPVKVGRSW